MTRESRGVEFAWRVHTAITDWTAKVDAKASIVLALETAGFAAIIAVSRDDQALGHLVGLALWAYRAGLVSLIGAVGIAGGVVMPRLGSHRARKAPGDGLIYFGHLRSRDPIELKRRLGALTVDEELDELCHQLVRTSEIAWSKHRWLQVSLCIAALSALLLAGAWALS